MEEQLQWIPCLWHCSVCWSLRSFFTAGWAQYLQDALPEQSPGCAELKEEMGECLLGRSVNRKCPFAMVKEPRNLLAIAKQKWQKASFTSGEKISA